MSGVAEKYVKTVQAMNKNSRTSAHQPVHNLLERAVTWFDQGLKLNGVES